MEMQWLVVLAMACRGKSAMVCSRALPPTAIALQAAAIWSRSVFGAECAWLQALLKQLKGLVVCEEAETRDAVGGVLGDAAAIGGVAAS